MNITKIVVGILDTNCYLLEKDGHVLIIDPGSEGNRIIKAISDNVVDGIVVTHHHSDHDGAVDDLLIKYNIKVYDINNMSEGINKIGKFKFQVIYTPGHRSDAISIYFPKEKVMFVGDFIFKDSIGRCDLETGNIKEMYESINKIKKYNSEIILYPGHGEKTVLGYEINNNPYFKDFL